MLAGKFGYVARCLIPVFVIFLLASQAFSAPEEETRIVAYLSKILEQGRVLLREKGVNREERIIKLKLGAEEYADFENISRIALGPVINELSDEQRKIYRESFDDYLTTVLALRLIVFKDPKFTVQSIRPVGKHHMVMTLATDQGRSVPIGWLMSKKDDIHAKVVDVIIGGASMLTAQRAEISQIYRNQGFDGLVSTLKSIAAKR